MRGRSVILVLAIMGTAIGAGIVATLPPAPRPDSAPASEFSADRAARHVAVIASEPHPTGSARNDAVRDYLVGELRTLGMQVEVQQGTAPGSEIMLRNIVAHRQGATGNRHLLLLAHYDAARDAPGAGDDAAGVAAILETLRALGPTPLANGLLVVFTDGEELGLLGARLFVRDHPRATDVGLVLNFEARGNSGPSYLFQTSPGNGALMREVGAAAPHPRANSLTGEVYRRLPNDTDLSVFLRELPSVPALNFAFIGGFASYHTPTDTPDALDRRSLQHHGSWALSLTRHFAAVDLGKLESSDAVYFDAPLLGLIRYPATWAVPLAASVLASIGVVVVVGLRRRSLRRRALLIGAAVAVGAVAATAMLSHFGWQALMGLDPGGTDVQSPLATSTLVLVAFVATAGVLAALMIRLGLRSARPLELAVPAITLWAAAGVAAALIMPGASWLFTWPAAAALLSAAFALRPATRDDGAALVGALGAVPALVLVPPIIWQLQVAMTNDVVAACAAFATLLALLAALPIAHILQRSSHA